MKNPNQSTNQKPRPQNTKRNYQYFLSEDIEWPLLDSFLINIQLLCWRIRTWGFILNRLRRRRLLGLFKNQLIFYAKAYPVDFCNRTWVSWIWKESLQASGSRAGLECEMQIVLLLGGRRRIECFAWLHIIPINCKLCTSVFDIPVANIRFVYEK